MSKGLIDRILNKLATVEQHDLTADFSTSTSGATLEAQATINGKVCHMILIFSNTNSIASGANFLTANLNNTNFFPKIAVNGTGYYGVHSIIANLTSEGVLTIRNASSTALTLGTGFAAVSLTYLIN